MTSVPRVSFRRRFDVVVAFAGALPPDAFLRRTAGAARHQRDAVGDDEGCVEADPELPDQLRGTGGVSAQTLEELARA